MSKLQVADLVRYSDMSREEMNWFRQWLATRYLNSLPID